MVTTMPSAQSQLKAITKTTRITVLCGGLSSERDVSLRSGQNCFDALKRLGYSNVTMLDMDRDVAQRLREAQTEVVFLALHGTYGEDGRIQGLLDILGIPYTGNSLTASAMTMDKDITKMILQSHQLPVFPWVTVNVSETNTVSPDDVQRIKALPYPVMVKPVCEGSSVGMSKVNSSDEVMAAVLKAAEHDRQVMVESYLTGQSLTVGVLDMNGQPTVMPILEMRTKTEWYDYEAKYTPGLTELIVPADISAEATEAIQTLTLKAHQAMRCQGLSRIDWVIAPGVTQLETLPNGMPNAAILEVNTIPGMTNLSDLPAQAKAMGVTYDELVDWILQTAVK